MQPGCRNGLIVVMAHSGYWRDAFFSRNWRKTTIYVGVDLQVRELEMAGSLIVGPPASAQLTVLLQSSSRDRVAIVPGSVSEPEFEGK